MDGLNQRAQVSHGIFAIPSTPIVTADVYKIELKNSQSWKAEAVV